MSKLKQNNFPWATLMNILAAQGLVMQGWPCSVLMPGEWRSNTSKAKDITILKVPEQHTLHDSLYNKEITVVRVEDPVEQSKYPYHILQFLANYT